MLGGPLYLMLNSVALKNVTFFYQYIFVKINWNSAKKKNCIKFCGCSIKKSFGEVTEFWNKGCLEKCFANQQQFIYSNIFVVVEFLNCFTSHLAESKNTVVARYKDHSL